MVGGDVIEITHRVWDCWRERAAEGEWSLEMLLRSPLPAVRAVKLARAAIGVAVDEFDAAHPWVEGEDDAVSGAWSVTETTLGAVVRVDEEPDEFEWMLRRVVGGLEEAGVTGTLDVYQPAAAPADVSRLMDPLGRADLLECRIRVFGETRADGPPYGWKADPAAYTAGVAAAVRWLCELPSEQQPTLVVHTTLVAVGPNDALLDLVPVDLLATHVVQGWSVGAGRFRGIALSGWLGRVTLIEGGDALAAGEWHPQVASLRGFLKASGRWADYGFVKRGRAVTSAVFANSLRWDWVEALPFPPHNYVDAPDVFGIQLLGPTLARRIHPAAGWQATPLPGDAVIVEHSDPAAWFAEMFPTVDWRHPDEPPPVPDVVARARRDLAAILWGE
jgi:hypothetical protein